MGKCILAGHPQAGGQIGYGTYKGDGTATRKISLGVTPKWVLVFAGGYLTFSNGIFGGLALPDSPVKTATSAAALKIVSGGFEVYSDSSALQTNNPNYTRYNYLYGF